MSDASAIVDWLRETDPWWPYGAAALGVSLLGLALLVLRVRAARSRGRAGQADAAKHYVAILAGEQHGALLSAAIAMRCVRVKSAQELLTLARRQLPKVVFIDADLLAQFGGELSRVPFVAIVDDEPAKTLSRMVRSLDSWSSLSHVISASLLSTPRARSELKILLDRLAYGPECDLLTDEGVGRVAMLAQASRREARFERMQEYFSKMGLSARTISAIGDVAEELVMNALYNAPAEAGFFSAPVSRATDVTLPFERACEISYGMEEGNAFVRLRDPFGALRRERLLEVLTRCNTTTGAELDESRGGAGLGMWRVFSAASTIAITVIPGRLTEILVRMVPKPGRGKQPRAIHLFFIAPAAISTKELDDLGLDGDSSMVDHSVTFLQN